MKMILAIAAGGAIGAVARYIAAAQIGHWLGTGFRWGILLVNIVGSFLMGVLVEAIQDHVAGEEARWQRVCWELYEKATEIGEGYWSDPVWMRLLNRLVPRSFECSRYGSKYPCAMTTICFQEEGWEDPLGSAKYVVRRPHHAPELEQAVARGVLVPEAGAAVGEGEGNV